MYRAGAILLMVVGAAMVAGCGEGAGGAGADRAEPLKTSAVFGEVGTSPGQFVMPRAMDSDGESLWIIDKSARVQQIDPETGRCPSQWVMPEFLRGKPVGVTAGPPPVGMGDEPVIYIADTHCHRVMIYRGPVGMDSEPELLGSFGSFGEGPGEFIYPTDVAVLPTADGKHAAKLYVSEYGDNDRVSVFGVNGTPAGAEFEFELSFGTVGTSDSADGIEFRRPQSIAIDPLRNALYVADACNHRIGRFTLEGKLVAWFGSPGTAGPEPDQMSYPYGLALLGDGTALVAEWGNHRLRHMDLDSGDLIGLYGTAGAAAGELASPWAVTLMGRTVYVLDSGNARVQGFEVPRRRRGAGSPGGGVASGGRGGVRG